MATKRKDKKGRVLKDGESQRSDGRYQYRYNGLDGKRHTVYGQTLDELRSKEADIQRDLMDGINCAGADITVLELCRRHFDRKNGLSPGTMENYKSFLRLLEKDPLGHRKISDITMGDCKDWLVRQSQSGKSWGTLTLYKSRIAPAFQDAVDDFLIRRNPFNFKLGTIIKNSETEKRTALSVRQQEMWLDFIFDDEVYYKYYDWFVVLFGTGLRVGEFCGLELRDLDFEEKRIRVERQVWRDSESVLHIRPPKTAAGKRYIPMAADVEASLHRMIATRKPDHEMIYDGHTQFLICTQDGGPYAVHLVEYMFRRALVKFREQNPNEPLFHLTPHVCRHTFATRMAEAGMDVKNLQYLMGHTTVTMTLGTYTHSSFESASAQMHQIDGSKQNSGPQITEI